MLVDAAQERMRRFKKQQLLSEDDLTLGCVCRVGERLEYLFLGRVGVPQREGTFVALTELKGAPGNPLLRDRCHPDAPIILLRSFWFHSKHQGDADLAIDVRKNIDLRRPYVNGKGVNIVECTRKMMLFDEALKRYRDDLRWV